MTALRRRVSHALARWAVRIDPDPPVTFTATRKVSLTAEGDREAFIRAFTAPIGGNLGLGLKKPPPDGTVVRY